MKTLVLYIVNIHNIHSNRSHLIISLHWLKKLTQYVLYVVQSDAHLRKKNLRVIIQAFKF